VQRKYLHLNLMACIEDMVDFNLTRLVMLCFSVAEALWPF